jgi:hypothetical protein
MTDDSVARIMAKTKRGEARRACFLASQNPGGTLISVGEVAEGVWESSPESATARSSNSSAEKACAPGKVR